MCFVMYVGEIEVVSDDVSSVSRAEWRPTASRKRQTSQSQARPLSPIPDEHGETSADESQPRRSKR